MASKDIQINGVQYTAVPSIEVKDKVGTGTVLYHEISDTTATASDVLSGKYFYTSAGVKTQGSVGTITGDSTTDDITATSTLIKLSVPNTGYYGDAATISATFKGAGSVLAAYDAQNSTAYNTDGANISVNAKTTNIPNGYYQGKQALVTQGVGTSNWGIAENSYVSDSNSSPYSFTISPSVNISTAGWVAQGDITAADGAERAVYVNAGSATVRGYAAGENGSIISDDSYGTPKVTVSYQPNQITAGWITSVSTYTYQDMYIKPGTATPAATINTSSYLSPTETAYSFTVTPSANIDAGDEGWISSISDGNDVTGYIKAGSASAPLTITDTSNALTGSSTDGTPKITTSITPSVTAGWITSVSTSGTGDKYIKKGTVALSASRTGGTAEVDNNGTYTVIVGASGTTTAGWVGSNPASASTTIKIKDANITAFDMLAADSTNTSSSKLTISLGHMVSSTPTNYVGYINGGSATISYGTLANADIASVSGTAKGLNQVTGKFLSDTTILGQTGTITSYNGLQVNSASQAITAGYYTGTATVKTGSATPSTTIGDTSSALTGSSADGTPTVTLTPTASVGTAGWISSISNGSVVTKYIKKGSATPNATINSSSYLSTTATAYSFTVTPTASVGTAGWISSISNGSNVTGYIKAGSVSSYTANTTGTVSVTEGYVAATTFTVPTVTPETAGTGGSGGSGVLTIE